MKPLFSPNSKMLRFSSQFCKWCKDNGYDVMKVRFHVIEGNITVFRATRIVEYLYKDTYPYFIRYNVDINERFINLKVD